MSIRKTAMAAVGAAVLATSIGVAAQAPDRSSQAQQYTVDWLMTGGPMDMTMHVWKDGGNQRVDMEMPVMESRSMQMYLCTQSMVVRPDLEKVWIITPYNHKYQERGFTPKTDLTDMRSDANKVEELGSETVNGQDCNKYRLSTDQGDMFLWMTKNGNVMMKMAQAGGTGYAIEARNLQLAAPAASVFAKPPADYELLSVTREAMKSVLSTMVNGMAASMVPGLSNARSTQIVRAQQEEIAKNVEDMKKNCTPMDMSKMMQMMGGRGRGRGR